MGQQELNLSPTEVQDSYTKALNEFYRLDAEIDRMEEELWEDYLNDRMGVTPSPHNDPSLAIMRAQAIKILTQLNYYN